MKESFSLWSYLLWAANAALELLIIRAWVQRHSLPHLTMLPVFVGFILLSDIAAFTVLQTGAFGPYGYAYTYWWTQTLGSLFRSLLAIQILSHVLLDYRYKVLLWSCYATFWIVAVFGLGLPTDMTRVFIRVLVTADLIGALLVGAAILIPSVHWPKGYTTAAFGLFFSLCSDVALYLIRFSTGTRYIGAIRAALPIASLLSLLLLLFAVFAGKKNGDEITRGAVA